MKESYEQGVANPSAPSFALGSARNRVKRKQGTGGLGIELRKCAIRTPTLFKEAEGNTVRDASASPGPACVVADPRARLETSCTRTGRPRGFLWARRQDGERRLSTVRLACTASRGRTVA